MIQVTLPSEFGPITLDIGTLEAPRYRDDRPRRHFKATLSAFSVNRKSYGSLRYDFYIEEGGRLQEDGKPWIFYNDLAVYGESGSRSVLTDKGHSKVRSAIDAAFLTFWASPEYKAATEQAEQGQRNSIVARGDDYISRLDKMISRIQALQVKARNPAIPAEQVEADLDSLWRERL